MRVASGLKLVIVLMGLVLASGAGAIEWVNFSTYVPGSLHQEGLESADGLVVDVTLSNTQHMRANFPVASSVDIDDPAWPFVESIVSDLVTIADYGHTLSTELKFEFTNSGGLPAGGSIAIVDLEDFDSYVTVAGLVDGVEVPVVWSVHFYQTAGINVPDAVWNPGTATLSGAMDIEDASGGSNNFSFLISDRALDAVVFTISSVNGDGIGYAASMTTVPDPTSIADNFGESSRLEELKILEPGFPNPFNPITTLRYNVRTSGELKLNIYRINGQLVKRLESGRHKCGVYEVQWNGTDDNGISMASGTYLAVIETEGQKQCRSLVLLK